MRRAPTSQGWLHGGFASSDGRLTILSWRAPYAPPVIFVSFHLEQARAPRSGDAAGNARLSSSTTAAASVGVLLVAASGDQLMQPFPTAHQIRGSDHRRGRPTITQVLSQHCSQVGHSHSGFPSRPRGWVTPHKHRMGEPKGTLRSCRSMACRCPASGNHANG